MLSGDDGWLIDYPDERGWMLRSVMAGEVLASKVLSVIAIGDG